MADPYDKYSKPLKIEKRTLCDLYYLNPRRKWAGREGVIAYDRRFPLFEGFENNYSSAIRFLEKGNCAGNHYHKRRGEMMLPVEGSFEIILEDIRTKKRGRFLINSKDNIAFYIKPGTAHAMTSLEERGLILEMSAAPPQESDIFPYPVAQG